MSDDRSMTVSMDPAVSGPLQALEWLLNGGGLSLAELAEWIADIEAERLMKRYWWES
jgi:hypothetical protein